MNHWDGLVRFLADSRIELDTNIVERGVRSIVLNRKNSLFADHDLGAENWACVGSLIAANAPWQAATTAKAAALVGFAVRLIRYDSGQAGQHLTPHPTTISRPGRGIHSRSFSDSRSKTA